MLAAYAGCRRAQWRTGNLKTVDSTEALKMNMPFFAFVWLSGRSAPRKIVPCSIRYGRQYIAYIAASAPRRLPCASGGASLDDAKIIALQTVALPGPTACHHRFQMPDGQAPFPGKIPPRSLTKPMLKHGAAAAMRLSRWPSWFALR